MKRTGETGVTRACKVTVLKRKQRARKTKKNTKTLGTKAPFHFVSHRQLTYEEEERMPFAI